jgi:CBS domain-containing protein
MSKDLKTVETDSDLKEAARIMRKYKIGCVPVVEESALFELVTTTDILETNS